MQVHTFSHWQVKEFVFDLIKTSLTSATYIRWLLSLYGTGRRHEGDDPNRGQCIQKESQIIAVYLGTTEHWHRTSSHLPSTTSILRKRNGL